MLRRALRMAALAFAVATTAPAERVDLRDGLTTEQLEWWAIDAVEKCLLCGRRAGKSTLLAAWLVDGASRAGENVWCAYISVTRKSAEENLWGPIKSAAQRSGVAHTVNEAKLTITFAGGGRILLGGCKDVDDIEVYRGKKYARVAFDECGAIRDKLLRTLYEDIIEPGTMDVGGEIAFAGTPGYFAAGLWYELTRDGAEATTGIPVRRWTALDNPHVKNPLAFFERIKAKRGWTDDTPSFKREYWGAWVVDIGQLVFPIVKGRNTTPCLPTHNGAGLLLDPARWRYVISLDLGVNDPTAVVVLAAHRDLAHYRFVVSVTKRSEWLIRELADHIKALRKLYPNAPIIADTGGMGKVHAHELSREYKLPIERADKADRLGQIHLVRDALISGTLQVVEEEATKPLVDEWSVLGWNPKKPGEPAEGDDHAGDATRYGLGRLHHYVTEDTKPKSEQERDAAREEMDSEKRRALQEADEQRRRSGRAKVIAARRRAGRAA